MLGFGIRHKYKMAAGWNAPETFHRSHKWVCNKSIYIHFVSDNLALCIWFWFWYFFCVFLVFTYVLGKSIHPPLRIRSRNFLFLMDAEGNGCVQFYEITSSTNVKCLIFIDRDYWVHNFVKNGVHIMWAINDFSGLSKNIKPENRLVLYRLGIFPL